MKDETRAIFIDVDGPLLPARAWVGAPRGEAPLHRWDPVAVRMINALVGDSRASLVVSSTWRVLGRIVFESHMLRNNLRRDVVEDSGDAWTTLHEDWATPHLVEKDRSAEVHAWLGDHPEVTHWVSFDDDYVARRDTGGMPIQVNFENGITLGDYNNARQYFGLRDADD